MAKKCKDCRRSVCRCAKENSQVAEPIPEIKFEDAGPPDPPFGYPPIPAYVPGNEILPKPDLEGTNEVARLAIPEEGQSQRR
jgi:hypothetical protein